MSFKILQYRLYLLLVLLMEISHDKSLYQRSGEWLAFHIYQQLMRLQPQSMHWEIHNGLCLVCRPQLALVHLMTKARRWAYDIALAVRWSHPVNGLKLSQGFPGNSQKSGTRCIDGIRLPWVRYSRHIYITTATLQTNCLNAMQWTSKMTKQSLRLCEFKFRFTWLKSYGTPFVTLSECNQTYNIFVS